MVAKSLFYIFLIDKWICWPSYVDQDNVEYVGWGTGEDVGQVNGQHVA